MCVAGVCITLDARLLDLSYPGGSPGFRCTIFPSPLRAQKLHRLPSDVLHRLHTQPSPIQEIHILNSIKMP